jgi:hypothetical protein
MRDLRESKRYDADAASIIDRWQTPPTVNDAKHLDQIPFRVIPVQQAVWWRNQLAEATISVLRYCTSAFGV